MSNENAATKCSTCDGVAHPATGSCWPGGGISCGPCVRRFWSWMHPLMNGKPRRRKGQAPSPSFYDHAYAIAPPLVVEPQND